MAISLIDLRTQYMSIKDEINAAVIDVLKKGQYILGPNVKALEEEVAAYCGVKYGVGVANGTDALLLSLLAYGIGPGDEVITTPYTFFATSEAICQVGATPVFVDIDPRTYNIDVQQIEGKITKRTKGIMPVHIFGQIADMDEIMDIANKYGLIVIEDACQAFGAEYKGKKAGALAHIGCFSFFPTKNLGGYGDGGIVVTDNEDVAAKIRVLRVHGSTRKYVHSVLGYNSRLDEMQAAILRVKLKYIDSWNDLRREKAQIYNDLLAGSEITTPCQEAWNRHIYHLFIARTQNRDEVVALLKENQVATAVYYPVPLHLQEVHSNLGYKPGSLPEAEKASRTTLALPMSPDLQKEDIHYIANLLRKSDSGVK